MVIAGPGARDYPSISDYVLETMGGMRVDQDIAFSDLSYSPINEREIVPVLARDGIVLFRRSTRKQLSSLIHDLADVRAHPHGTFGGETVIEPHSMPASAGGAGFTRRSLPPHTDRALTSHPPAVVAVLIEQPAEDGGQCLLVDTRTLLLAAGPDFASLTLDAGRTGRYPVFRSDAGYGQIRFRDDDLAKPHAPSASGRSALGALRALAASAVAVTLAAGEGYMVHNHRVLHGRTEFRGYRRATRFLADMRSGSPYAWMNHGFRLSD